MAMTNNERLEAYRNRMYAAGYKQARIWIPRDSEREPVKIERKMFLRRLEAMTAGWSKAKLSRFLGEILEIASKKIKEKEAN